MNRISKYITKGMFFKQTFPTELLLPKNCRIVQSVKLMHSNSKMFKNLVGAKCAHVFSCWKIAKLNKLKEEHKWGKARFCFAFNMF